MDKNFGDADDNDIFQPGPIYKSESSWFSKGKLLPLVIVVTGVILLIIGIVLIASAKKSGCINSAIKGPRADFCDFSEEAKRIDFGDFINRVKTSYYKLHPYNVIYDPDVGTDPDSIERVKAEFTPYDPNPVLIKARTDAALSLLDDIQRTDVQVNRLKPRERKALQQVKHYLRHVFGRPYDVNFYAGDWLLGPNSFCWQPVCTMGYSLFNAILYHKPMDLEDAELLLKKLKTHKLNTDQYVSNMKMGILKGMIRSEDECKAGYDAIARTFLNISLYNETGVLKEWYTQAMLSDRYFSKITPAMNEEWKNTHNSMNVSESMKQHLVDYVGKPIVDLLRYLKEEHLRHCVPSSVSSGLAGLPVKYVYTDGVANTSWPTDPTLPLTDMVLDGKKAYAMIMPYFTTNDMTPDQVNKLGHEMLDKLYPKAVQIAREMTKIYNDNDTAVMEFRKILNSSESYFNDQPIPQNESNAEAHRKCSNLKGAKKHCPTRWQAMMKWFDEARRVMSMLNPKMVSMFYFTGDMNTTPNCPVDLSPDLNPSSAAQSYESSGSGCTGSATYNIPFFLERMGPKFSEWSVNAHEARPGHHLQVQGNIENFQDSCGGSIGWLDSETYYTAFSEGWALYAENPLIAEDTDTYNNEPMQKFGMLKWQIWRALRLIVDTGLHYKDMTRTQALQLFNDKAWDGTDLAKKEVTRYQSNPGQATAYMIGQLDILKARNYATAQLGKRFNLKDFHYQVLSQGSSPLGYLSDHIRLYVGCTKDPTKTGCKEILTPPKKKTTNNQEREVRSKVPFLLRKPGKRHYV